MSIIAPVHALSVLSVHLSEDEHQEFLDKFPSTYYGEKNPSKIIAKVPTGITLTLHQVKLLDKTPGNSNGGNITVEFPSGQKWVKFMEINQQN